MLHNSGFTRAFGATLLTACILLLPTAEGQNVRPKTITRVFWQDRESGKLSFADIVATNKWNLKRGWVQDYPSIDAKSQSLSDIRVVGIAVVAGLSATEKNSVGGGWIVLDSGVFEEPHGNHFHWRYSKKPRVLQQNLTAADSGVTAVVNAERSCFLAGLPANGFTKVSAASLKSSGGKTVTPSDGLRFTGGGRRPIIAALNEAVAYAAWGEAEGESAGRVDVVNLKKPGAVSVAYSFQLPGGDVRAAAASSNKVYFATSEGIYRIDGDARLEQSTDTVKPIPVLAKSGETSTLTTTETFSTDRNWLIFSSSGQSPSLCLINSAVSQQHILRVPIPMENGLTLSAPRIKLSLGKRYAFLFQTRTGQDSSAQEMLTVVELDPNRDRNFSDARVKLSVPVGASKVSGQFGQHDICFDAYGHYAVFTEPGTGILNLMALKNLRVVARFRVGGAPDRIIAVGAPEHFH